MANSFINKSGILPWKREIIANKVPDKCGVYILRSNITLESVLYIGKADFGRLRERILEHFNSGDIRGVNFFDWYETRTEEDAATLENFWKTKYNPPYNIK